MYKIYDKVRMKNNYIYALVSIGDIGTITKVLPGPLYQIDVDLGDRQTGQVIVQSEAIEPIKRLVQPCGKHCEHQSKELCHSTRCTLPLSEDCPYYDTYMERTKGILERMGVDCE